MSTRRLAKSYGAVGTLLILSLFLINSFAGTPAVSHAPSPVKEDGALDPSLPGHPRPEVLPRNEVVPLDIAVGPNVLTHSRQLCPNGRGLQQNETSVVAAGNIVIAAFNDARGPCQTDRAAVGWGYSLDSGATWTDGGGLPSPRQLNNGDPWLGVSPDGQTFYLSGLYNFYQGIGFLRGYLDPDAGAIVWDSPVVISLGGSMDKEAFVVDPNDGTIYMSYTNLEAGIKLSRSTDQGTTWRPAVTVATGSVQGSFPAVDNYGNIYIAYNIGYPSANVQTSVARSTDGGATFQRVFNFPFRTNTVPFLDRTPAFPQLAVDMSGGTRDGWVYVVWNGLDAGNVHRPYISHSEDGGETWSEPTRISGDTASGHQWYPSVSVDDLGNVNVIYYDRRNNPGTGLTDVYLAQSTDGASTFIEVRVTDVSGQWQGVGRDPGFIYGGDYIRAISYGTDVYATWTDPRNGDPDVYFSRISGGAIAQRSRN